MNRKIPKIKTLEVWTEKPGYLLKFVLDEDDGTCLVEVVEEFYNNTREVLCEFSISKHRRERIGNFLKMD